MNGLSIRSAQSLAELVARVIAPPKAEVGFGPSFISDDRETLYVKAYITELSSVRFFVASLAAGSNVELQA